MKVGELIAKLKEFDEKMEVRINEPREFDDLCIDEIYKSSLIWTDYPEGVVVISATYEEELARQRSRSNG